MGQGLGKSRRLGSRPTHRFNGASIFVTKVYFTRHIGTSIKKSKKMEIVNQKEALRSDNSLLAITHLSQLLTYVTGFGGLIVPLFIWLTSKDKVIGMDEHGKAIINFQLSIILLIILSIPAILLFGLGILSLIFIGIVSFVLPIVNAVKASNGESPSYFMTFRFFS